MRIVGPPKGRRVAADLSCAIFELVFDVHSDHFVSAEFVRVGFRMYCRVRSKPPLLTSGRLWVCRNLWSPACEQGVSAALDASRKRKKCFNITR